MGDEKLKRYLLVAEVKVVILSGGMDSAVCLAMARAEDERILAVCFDYGQRHRREIEAARLLALHYEAEFMLVNLDTRAWGGSALTAEIDVPLEESASIPTTYVPARNIIFLSIALSIAEAKEADGIFLGVNAVDYSGYPDCRPQFIEAFQHVARLGQKCGVEGRPIDIRTPLISLSKADIVSEAIRLQVPLDHTWSCYIGGESPCGQCDSCRLRARGFKEAGTTDPLLDGVEAVTG